MGVEAEILRPLAPLVDCDAGAGVHVLLTRDEVAAHDAGDAELPVLVLQPGRRRRNQRPRCGTVGVHQVRVPVGVAVVPIREQRGSGLTARLFDLELGREQHCVLLGEPVHTAHADEL